MSEWADFLKDVRPSAPGIPLPVVEHAVKRAAQKFCKDTRAWIVELDRTRTREGVTSYDMELDQGVELVRLKGAKLNGVPYAVWRAGEEPCGRRYVYTGDGKTIRFSEPVEAGLSLVLTCAVKPSNSATGIDNAIFDRYVEEIALLAVSKLTGDPNKLAEYLACVARIKTDLWRGMAATRARARARTGEGAPSRI